MRFKSIKFTNTILLFSTALLFSLFTGFSDPEIAEAELGPTDIEAESSVDDEDGAVEENISIPEVETVDDIPDVKTIDDISDTEAINDIPAIEEVIDEELTEEIVEDTSKTKNEQKKQKKVREATVENTINRANSIDYVSLSIVPDDTVPFGLENTEFAEKFKKKLTVAALNQSVKSYGKYAYDSNRGMDYSAYTEAFSYEWKQVKPKKLSEGEKIIVDINSSYTYDDLVKIMRKMASFDNVTLIDIGLTAQGRTIYAIEINQTNETNPQTIMLTGNVHARETAGTMYILKHLAEILQSESAESKNLLSKYRIVSVPCVNPDGREAIAFDPSHHTYSTGKLWKSNSQGTDINRNFPGVSGFFIKSGYRMSNLSSTSPTKEYYPGQSLGCSEEAKALMKFLYYYVACEQATTLIDYHQQGRISYAGKPWQTKEQEDRCVSLAKYMLSNLNYGNSYKYTYVRENNEYGLNGVGSTLTDYACSIAMGAKYSPKYGCMVFVNKDKTDKTQYPLTVIGSARNLGNSSIPTKKGMKIKQVNSKFETMTFEIGLGSGYLGYSSSARKLLANEYTNYHFGRVLYILARR